MSDTRESLIQAILADHRARVKTLLKKEAELARLVVAEARCEAAIVHWIYSGDSALHIAAAGYRVEIARLLLAAGADVRAIGKHRFSQPLHYAADGHLASPAWDPKRQVAMIRLLLEAGADLHAQDKNGATPLHRAVRTRCAAAVQCLLEAGSDPTILNKPGSTPFHLAVQNTGRGGSGTSEAREAQRQIIQMFLDQRVSTGLKDRAGKTVLQWAKSDWILQMLTSAPGPR